MRWSEQEYLDYLKRKGVLLTPAHSAKNKKEKPPNIVYLQDKATHGVMTHEEQASTLGRSALSPTPRASSHQEDEPMRSTVTLPLFLPPLPQQILCQLALPGEPGTKARPRFGSKVYTPRETKDAEDYIAWSIRKAYPKLQLNRSHDLGVCVAFFTKNRQRKDLDNLIKLLFDACNGILWADDVQVIQVASTIRRGDTEPRTEFVVYTIGESSTGTCQHCGSALPQRGKQSVKNRNNKFCSKTCYDEAQRKGQYVFCWTCKARIYKQNEKLRQARQFCSSRCRALAHTAEKLCRYCQQPFRNRGTGIRHQSFCSLICRETWHKTKRMPSQKKGICPRCGVPSTSPGQRCHACFTFERTGRLPLTNEEKRTIVTAWNQGASMNSLAKHYHVTQGSIAKIVHELATVTIQDPVLPFMHPEAKEASTSHPQQLGLFVA